MALGILGLYRVQLEPVRSVWTSCFQFGERSVSNSLIQVNCNEAVYTPLVSVQVVSSRWLGVPCKALSKSRRSFQTREALDFASLNSQKEAVLIQDAYEMRS